VEIGAFRTYPLNYSPPGEVSVEEQVIPLDKIEDFGVHYTRYYPLEVSYFKNSKDSEIIDVLWNKYWVSNLTQNSLFSNKKYFSDGVCDLARKADKQIKNMKRDKIVNLNEVLNKETKQNTAKDFTKYSMERSQAFLNEGIKNILFSTDI
jgi:COP9 signalosome complex subunit 5